MRLCADEMIRVLFGATTFIAVRLFLRSRKEPKEPAPAPGPPVAG